MAIFEKSDTPDSSSDDDFPILSDFDELDKFGSNPQPGIRENDVPQNDFAQDSNFVKPAFDIVHKASDKATLEASVANHPGDVRTEAPNRDEKFRPEDKTLEGPATGISAPETVILKDHLARDARCGISAAGEQVSEDPEDAIRTGVAPVQDTSPKNAENFHSAPIAQIERALQDATEIRKDRASEDRGVFITRAAVGARLDRDNSHPV